MRRLGYCFAQYSPQAQWMADLDRAVTLGGKAVRLDIVPCYTANGTDFHEVDAKVAAIVAHGLQVHAMLPHWLTEDKKQHTDSASIAQLRTFGGRVAAHFGTKIKRVELGNETGSPPFTGGQKPLPDFQAAVTEALIDGLGGVYPVVTPGLAPVSGGAYIEIAKFLGAYWPALGQTYRDAIAGTGVHLYSPARVSDKAYFKSYGQLNGAHSITGKPFVVTEFNVIGQTPLVQASEVTNALNVLRARGDVDQALFYELTNQGSETGYGAFDAHGAALPVAVTLKNWKVR